MYLVISFYLVTKSTLFAYNYLLNSMLNENWECAQSIKDDTHKLNKSPISNKHRFSTQSYKK